MLWSLRVREVNGDGKRQDELQTLLLPADYVQGVENGPLENSFTPRVSDPITKLTWCNIVTAMCFPAFVSG